MREQFHNQLKCSTDQMYGRFIQWADRPAIHSLPTNDGGMEQKLTRFNNGDYKLPVQVSDRDFIPIYIRDQLDICPSLSVDITIYSAASRQRALSNAGDIDNRVKSLLDALRMPSEDELKREKWQPDEPCWVVMEDDSFITNLSVTQERLLGSPNDDNVTAIVKIGVLSSA